MEKYYWTMESFGADYPPENADEIIDKANELIAAYAETADAPDELAAFSERLWERYCTTGEIAE